MPNPDLSTISKFKANSQMETGFLPLLDPEVKIDVIEAIELKSGDTANLFRITPAHLHAVVELYNAAKNDPDQEGKDYLLDRTIVDHQKTINMGVLYGLEINGRLAAIAGFAPVNDPADTGRGNQDWTGDNNQYPLDEQGFLKSIVVHPSIKYEKIGAMKIFLPHRVCYMAANHPDRLYLLLKTNSPIAQGFYSEIMEDVEHHELPAGKELDTRLEDNEKILITYFIPVENAIDLVKKEWPDVYVLYANEIKAAQQRHLASQMLHKESVPVNNDNFKLQFAPV